jgi:hypothetical protein
MSHLRRFGIGDMASPPGYGLNPLSLSFIDGEVERRFTAEHLNRALPTIRVFLLAACAL